MLKKNPKTISVVLELIQPGEPICFKEQKNRLFFLGNTVRSTTLEPS